MSIKLYLIVAVVAAVLVGGIATVLFTNNNSNDSDSSNSDSNIISEGILDVSNDIRYVLTSDGKLSITGSGDIVANGDKGLNVKNPEKVKTVYIDEGITSLPRYSFKDMPDITKVSLPDSLTSLDAFTFNNCSKLKNATLGPNIKNVNPTAFSGCTSLEFVDVSSANPYFKSTDGCVCDKDLAILWILPEGKSTLTLPSTVHNIVNASSPNLKSIQCGSIMGVGNNWNGFTALENITYTDTTYGLRTYDNAIYNSSFTELLYYPMGKTTLRIPSTVSKISTIALQSTNTTLSNVILEGSNDNLYMEGGVLYNSDKTTVIGRLIKTQESASILDSVTSVGDCAFYRCSVKSISLDGAITNIGEQAFWGSSLESVIIGENVNNIQERAFEGCERLKVVNNYSDLIIMKGSTSNGQVARYAEYVYDY